MAKKSTFGSKGLQMAGHDVCQDIYLANGSANKRMPKSLPWNAYYDNKKFIKKLFIKRKSLSLLKIYGIELSEPILLEKIGFVFTR